MDELKRAQIVREHKLFHDRRGDKLCPGMAIGLTPIYEGACDAVRGGSINHWEETHSAMASIILDGEPADWPADGIPLATLNGTPLWGRVGFNAPCDYCKVAAE